MPMIYLIRHGRAAASFTDDLDPGLDELGHQQARDASTQLRQYLPLVLKSSPLKRALETAAPLRAELQQSVAIEQRVAEIPSPGLTLEARGPWLRTVMMGRWGDTSPELQQWRRDLIDSLLEAKADTAFFSHFVAINVAVGAAEGTDQVSLFRPDNGSITILSTDGKALTLVSRGAEAGTRIN